MTTPQHNLSTQPGDQVSKLFCCKGHLQKHAQNLSDPLYKTQVLRVKKIGREERLSVDLPWLWYKIGLTLYSSTTLILIDTKPRCLFSLPFAWTHCYIWHGKAKGHLMHTKCSLKHLQILKKFAVHLPGFPADKSGRGSAQRHGSTAIAGTRGEAVTTLRDRRGPGAFCRLYGELGTEPRAWHLHWWNCQWLQTPLTHNSHNNLQQLKTCPQESALQPSALTARDQWLLQVRFFVLFC